ncbi:MAG: hypothetical protein ACMVO5_12160 [Polymorphobacter sp.]|uniref:hypothetical protein n=1 Tax=Polymorphobacter sp. TaxID=1909290 RepID=UPI003A8A66CB
MTSQTTRHTADEPQDPLRRIMLGGLAGLAAAAAAGRANAQEKKDDKPVFNAYDRKRRFLENEMNGTPWVAPQQGNFDLEDPVQNALAKLKISANLAGERTYIPMLTRILIAREDLPGGLLLGAASMFTWQLQVPDPKNFTGLPEGTALMRSMFTSVYLDPHTLEPVKTLKNPYNDTVMELEDYIFVENFLIFPKGGSVFIEEPQFANDSPDTPKPALIKRWGDELILFNGGVYQEPGKHQPRFTENTWRSPAAQVMNPDVPLVQTGYNFMGVNKAFEKPWTGYKLGDLESMCSLATGKKVHTPETLPDFHKRVLVERHPDRL